MEWNRKLTALVVALVLLMSCIPAMADAVAELPGLDSRYLLLASAAEPLDAAYVPQGLESLISRRNDGSDENGGVYMASSQNMQLVDVAYAALKSMFAAAEGEGVTLYVRQAYRDYADEAARYERLTSRGQAADLPGQSDWQTGLAVTVVGKSLRTKTLTAEAYTATKEGQWVLANAARFGFTLRYPDGKSDVTGHAYEPWHLRYVGESVATYIVQNNLSLEEFRALLDGEVGAYVMPEADTTVKQVAVWTPSDAAEAPVVSAFDDDNAAMDAYAAELAELEPADDADDKADAPAEAVVAPVEAVVAPVEAAPMTPAPDLSAVAGLPALDNRFLLLANAAEQLSPDYEPAGMVSLTSRRNNDDGVNENGGVYMASSQNMQLVAEVYAALQNMMNDAEAQGVTLYVRQAYRSYGDELTRYERLSGRGQATEMPGQSDWQTGLAVTVVGKSLRTKTLTGDAYLATAEGQWVTANASAYGFVLRYPAGKESLTGHDAEPWHLRYVGDEVAAYMAGNGLCLEELRALADAATGGFVMPEGAAAPTPRPTATPAPTATPMPTPSPVPDILPGGAKFMGYTDDGDFEYSLFGE